MTLGEKIVRTEFNPSELDIVSQIKQKSAEVINMCVDIQKINVQKHTNILNTEIIHTTERRDQLDDEVMESTRLIEKAMDAYEEATMWAVKAATVKIK